jgi:hypothetical protein
VVKIIAIINLYTIEPITTDNNPIVMFLFLMIALPIINEAKLKKHHIFPELHKPDLIRSSIRLRI